MSCDLFKGRWSCHVMCSSLLVIFPFTYQLVEQMAFFELCAAQWIEFDRCCGCLGDWLTLAEEKVGREVYGSTLDEVASFGAVLEVRGWGHF